MNPIMCDIDQPLARERVFSKMYCYVFPLLVTLGAISCTAAISTNVSGVTEADKPHILFLLVDDWGWANVGYHRNPPTKEVVTPNFDSLVKEGLELDQHYAFRFCSPSRCSLLSGRLPIHVNDKNEPVSNYNPNDKVSGFAGIPRNMTTISQKLKSAGYATHQVGKWHAGGATSDLIPMGRKFDSSFGYLNAANDYYNQTDGRSCNGTPIVDLWDTNKPAKDKNGTGYEDALFKERLLQVVNNHDTSVPLFLYYTPHIVHGPLEVPDEYLHKFDFIDDNKRQRYHAMVNYLDDILGELISLLKQRDLWDNLLFVMSSDNGGPLSAGANNYPLKGGKTTDWQGGVRVNAFVSGGYLPMNMRGKKTDGYIHIADWYATFCSLAGVDSEDEAAAQAKLPPPDSLNMWPLISGKNSTSPRIDIPVSNMTLISGDYKILTGELHQACWTGPQYPNTTVPETKGTSIKEECGESGCLYNVKDDPNEHMNLASKLPDKLKEMQAKLAAYQATYFNPDRGSFWPDACNIAIHTYGGFWGPYIDLP